MGIPAPHKHCYTCFITRFLQERGIGAMISISVMTGSILNKKNVL